MMRWVYAGAVLLLALSASPASARTFTIGGVPFSETDIIDARALPSMDGKPLVMISLSEAAAKRLEALTKTMIGKMLPFVLDGRTIASPLVKEPLAGGTLEIEGVGSMPDVIALARQISGKAPLPDSLDE